MTYERPTNPVALTPEEKTDVLNQYCSFYSELARRDPAALNKKPPRSALATSLGRIGELILSEARTLAASNDEVRNFLDENELPNSMGTLMPNNFRVFCLLLNALKQWLSAEQAATDRFLLGGTARERCRQMVTSCLVTGEALTGKIELHHPVRDGRPPIPLSQEGHKIIEKQTASGDPSDNVEYDAIARLIGEVKKPNQSWSMLRRGCRMIIGLPPSGGTPASNASAKTLARRAIANTNLTAEGLLDWLDASQRTKDA